MRDGAAKVSDVKDAGIAKSESFVVDRGDLACNERIALTWTWKRDIDNSYVNLVAAWKILSADV